MDKLYVATFEDPNTGVRDILLAHFDEEQLVRYVSRRLRVYRFTAWTGIHRLFGMKEFPLDFDSVTTTVYVSAEEPEDG